MKRTMTAALSAMLLSSCGGQDLIRVANVPHDWFNAPLILAISGWKGGKPAKVKTFALNSGLASETAVMSGNAEVGLASPVVILRDPEAEKKLLVLGCYMQSGSVLGIASRGQTATPPVGYVPNTISQVFLAKYMIKAGKGDGYFSGGVRLLPVVPPQAAANLENGSVNSVVVWEPHLSKAGGKPGASLYKDETLYQVHVCLITSRQAYVAHRPAIDAFAQNVRAASDYTVVNPAEARSIVEKEADLPGGILAPAWNDVDFHYRSAPAELHAIFTQERDDLVTARMLPPRTDVGAYLAIWQR